MNLRERLLSHLRDAAYRPANETELSRRLGVAKQEVIDKALNRLPEHGLPPTSVQAMRC